MKPRALAIQALVWALAIAMKWFFASASPEALKWLMGPTVSMVSFVTQVPFVFEKGVGYFSQAAHYTVIPACSGLNFLVVAWVALAWVFAAVQSEPTSVQSEPTSVQSEPVEDCLNSFPLPQAQGERLVHSLKLVALSGVAALGLTYVTNALRLSLAVSLHMSKWSPPLLSPEEAHRLLGVAVYVLALMIACSAAQREFTIRGAGLILGIYWFFTLVLPLANGAWRNADFPSHFAWVLASSTALGACFCLLRARWAAVQSSTRPGLTHS